MNEQSLFKSALEAQARHVKFLQSTEGNVSTYYFGKKVNMHANSSTLFPKINLIDTIMMNKPNPYNPMQFLLNAFVDEITESQWTIDIESSLGGQELLTDMWEKKLETIHKKSKRRVNLRRLILEMFFHGYFGLYFDGNKWYPLTAYDVIPGDSSIPNYEDQPFIVRLTKVPKKYIIDSLNYNKDCDNFLGALEDLDNVVIYDIWCKALDTNVAYLQNGKMLYKQKLPTPKRYPFFGAIDTELLNSFYTVPVTLVLAELLDKFQKSLGAIDKNAKSISNPLLVYDIDSGIDIDKVVERMQQEYKQIIVGKNREGDIGYKAPGQIPQYAVNMPEVFQSQMMRHLGINDAFLGNPMAGVRERGALTNLIKASFRKLEAKVILIEEAFTDMDNYILDYYDAHQNKFKENFGLKTPTEFFIGSKLTAEDYLVEFSNKDTSEEKNMTLNKYRSGLISQTEALKALGHKQPGKIMKEQEEESLNRELIKAKAQMEIRELLQKDTVTLVFEKLKGRLQYKFWTTPIEGNKVLVKVSQSDKDITAKLLLDMSERVFIDVTKEKEESPVEQDSMDVQPTPPPTMEELQGQPLQREQQPQAQPQPQPQPQPQQEQQPQFEQQMPDKEQILMAIASGQIPEEQVMELINSGIVTQEEVAAVLESAQQQAQPSPDEMQQALSEQQTQSGGGFADRATELAGEKGAAPFERDTKPDLDALIAATQKNRTKIQPTKEMMALPALYFNEPIAKNLAEGKQVVFLKPKKMPELLEEQYLLAGKKVYGIVTVRDIIDDFDFVNDFKYHQMSDASRQKNWGDAPLFMYVFDFQEFNKPVDYTPEPGAKNIINIRNPKI